MKKLLILALSAVMAVSISAQDKRQDDARGEKASKEVRLERGHRDGHFEKGGKDGRFEEGRKDGRKGREFSEDRKEDMKKMSREERVEFEIKHFTKELYLSDKQAENFAKTYREYCAKADELLPEKCKEVKDNEKKAERKELSDKELDKLAKERFAKKKEFIKLQETYYDKFRKDLNARQVEKVLKHRK